MFLFVQSVCALVRACLWMRGSSDCFVSVSDVTANLNHVSGDLVGEITSHLQTILKIFLFCYWIHFHLSSFVFVNNGG